MEIDELFAGMQRQEDIPRKRSCFKKKKKRSCFGMAFNPGICIFLQTQSVNQYK